ncbi:MAG: nucleotidyltransferase family protein [Eubacteriales bacterium]|nr:nucleotidyltransferase family protein [Eubacteriales bacterium]
MKEIAMIMLAAGNSRRFGSNKLLYKIEGQPMYSRILGQLKEVQRCFPAECENMPPEFCVHEVRDMAERQQLPFTEQPAVKLTVVTQYREIGDAAQKAGAQVLYNPHPDEGISSSLQIGLKANRNADACLFTVSDQPWLTCATILGLLRLYLDSGKGIACVSSGGKLGNPCIFSRKYYPELMELRGDVGGKHVITAHRNDTAVLTVEQAAELRDVDTL